METISTEQFGLTWSTTPQVHAVGAIPTQAVCFSATSLLLTNSQASLSVFTQVNTSGRVFLVTLKIVLTSLLFLFGMPTTTEMPASMTGNMSYIQLFAYLNLFRSYSSFGGWNTPAIKQYDGDNYLCGTGVDMNFY